MVSPKQKADDIKRFLFKSYRKDIKVISEVSFLHYGLQGRVDILCIDMFLHSINTELKNSISLSK